MSMTRGASPVMRLSRRNLWYKVILQVVLVLMLAAAASFVYAAEPEGKTYIEFIIDASSSMKDKVEGSYTRMDVAKEVLKELVESLDDDPMLEIALRVYGSQLPGKSACEDSGLMVDFGPVGKVRASILQVVESLSPKGMTPIGYSLREAAKDFPQGKDGRNVIVLVTDGEESCLANPCAISQQLQDQGIILKPYVVGFALSAKAEEKVRCIGHYFSANDRASLRDALSSIMVEVVAAPSLEVEAWADGKNVTAQTEIQVLDASGRPAEVEVKAKAGDVLRLSAAEGVYTVTGKLVIDGEPIEVSEANVALKGGETTRVRLDFGTSTGKIVLYATAGGRAIPPSSLSARIFRDGRDHGELVSEGDRLSIRVQPGVYDLRCDYRSRPQQSLGVEGIEVQRGETKVIELAFQRPGRIVVKAIIEDRPSNEVNLELYQNDRLIGQFEQVPGERGVFEAGVLEGSYDILAIPRIQGLAERWLREVLVRAGETVEREIVIGPSKIRLKFILDGKPYSDLDGYTRVMVYHAGTEEFIFDLEEVEKGVFEARCEEGLYDLYLIDIGAGFRDRWIRDVEVRSGEMYEQVIDLGGKGKIRFEMFVDGKPYADYYSRVMVYEAGTYGDEYIFDLEQIEEGIFEREIKEGVYDLVVLNLGTMFGQGEIWFRDVEVLAGETFEKILDFGRKCDVRLKVTYNGRPATVDDIRILVYDAETEDYIRDLEETIPGVFQGDLIEGVYDFEMTNYRGAMWVMRDVELTGGRFEKEFDLTEEDFGW